MSKELFDRSPPRDRDAELRLLACCIVDASQIDKVTSEDFYGEMAVALFQELTSARQDSDGGDHAKLFLTRIIGQRDRWYQRFRYPIGVVIHKALTLRSNVREMEEYIDRVRTARKYRKMIDLALADIQDAYEAWDQQAMVYGITES